MTVQDSKSTHTEVSEERTRFGLVRSFRSVSQRNIQKGHNRPIQLDARHSNRNSRIIVSDDDRVHASVSLAYNREPEPGVKRTQRASSRIASLEETVEDASHRTRRFAFAVQSIKSISQSLRWIVGHRCVFVTGEALEKTTTTLVESWITCSTPAERRFSIHHL